MHTKEEKIEMGRKALEELKSMFKAWLKSDFNWVLETVTIEGTTGEDDEWDFLRSEWIDKFENWMYPYVNRLRNTKYVTKEDLEAFSETIYDNMKIMLLAIYALSRRIENERSA